MLPRGSEHIRLYRRRGKVDAFAKAVRNSLHRCNARILLVIGCNDRPRRTIGRCLRKHLVNRHRILTPLAAVAEVFEGKLPSFERRLKTIFKPRQLLFL